MLVNIGKMIIKVYGPAACLYPFYISSHKSFNKFSISLKIDAFSQRILERQCTKQQGILLEKEMSVYKLYRCLFTSNHFVKYHEYVYNWTN